MKSTTRIAIAALLHSAGQVLTALAADFSGEAPSEAATPEQPAEEKPKRGRKPAPPAAAEPAPVETPAEPAPATPEPAASAANALPSEEEYQKLRALIDPLVKAGQGADVKKTIAKYSPEGGLRTMDPKHHAAFEKDIAALSY